MGNCAAYDPKIPEFKWLPCLDLNYYICQAKQIPHPLKVETMFQPDIVLPLDNITETNVTESLIAFPELKIYETKLWSSASFLGHKSSYIDIDNSARSIFTSNLGITISFWLMFSALDTKIDLIDFRDEEDSKTFILFVEDKIMQAQICNPAECHTFKASSDFEENVWTFAAFTFCNIDKKGTFYMNESLGFESNEGFYFYFEPSDVREWLRDMATEGNPRIGASKFNDDENFHGRMSCLQYYSRSLTPGQVYQLMKTCYLPSSHNRTGLCPEGFTLLFDQCYKLAEEALTYSEAELYCIGQPNHGQPSTLAYPSDFFNQELLMILANRDTNEIDIWLGLDSRSGRSS